MDKSKEILAALYRHLVSNYGHVQWDETASRLFREAGEVIKGCPASADDRRDPFEEAILSPDSETVTINRAVVATVLLSQLERQGVIDAASLAENPVLKACYEALHPSGFDASVWDGRPISEYVDAFGVKNPDKQSALQLKAARFNHLGIQSVAVEVSELRDAYPVAGAGKGWDIPFVDLVFFE